MKILRNNFYIRDIFNLLKKENIAFLSKEKISSQTSDLCRNNYVRLAVYSFEKYPLDTSSGYMLITSCGKSGNMDLASFIQKKYKMMNTLVRSYIYESIVFTNNCELLDKLIELEELGKKAPMYCTTNIKYKSIIRDYFRIMHGYI